MGMQDMKVRLRRCDMAHHNKAGQSGKKSGSIIDQTLKEPVGQTSKAKKKQKKQSKGKQKH